MHHRTFSMLVSFAVVLASACGVSQAQEEPSELLQARAVFQKDVDFVTRPIRDRYVSRLDSLKRALGSRGDARGALAVQEEIDRVKETGGGADKLAGIWSIKYSTGEMRTYSITAEGNVTMTELNGLHVPPKTAKITIKGPDFIVEVIEGIFERLSIAHGKLAVDHFNPKATYPAGQPSARGTGTRVASAKP